MPALYTYIPADILAVFLAAYVFLDLLALYVHEESAVHRTLAHRSLFLLLVLKTWLDVRHR